MSLSVAEAGI